LPSRREIAPAHRRTSRASAPSHAGSKLPSGPIAVTASTSAPVWSNTGADSALMPGIGSPTARASPRRFTSASSASISARGRRAAACAMTAGSVSSRAVWCCAIRAGSHAANTCPVAVLSIDITVPGRMLTWIGRADSWMWTIVGPCEPSTASATVWPIASASAVTAGIATRTGASSCRLTRPSCSAKGPRA